jgi:hypothetical protein
MNKEQLRMQMLAGIITEGQYKAMLNENWWDEEDEDEDVEWKDYPTPSWFDNFIEQLADRLQIDPSDLPYKMVDPHLVGFDMFSFSQEGLDNFPKDARFVLKQPEFAGKGIVIWDSTGRITDTYAQKYPNLKKYLYSDEYYWVYIK